MLIVKPSAIGDVVHTLPMLDLLRRRWPQAHIAWLVTPQCAGVLEGHPQLDEVIRFERRLFAQAWRPRVFVRLVRLLRDLRGRDFDLVLDFQGLLRSGLMTWATRAPRRYGFAAAREGAWLFYNRRIDVGTVEQHAIERYLKLTEAACGPAAPGVVERPAPAHGEGTAELRFVFPATDADRAHVQDLLPAGRGYAVLLPGTNWPTKRWPIERFAALVGPLRERYGLLSVVAGGPDDVSLGEQVAGAVNLAGRTTLRQLVALLEGAAVVIANDSGPMHVAAALGRPLVTLFGPTNPVRTGPWNRADSVLRRDLPCSPCYSRRCRNAVHLQCLREIDVEAVLAAAERQMRLSRDGETRGRGEEATRGV